MARTMRRIAAAAIAGLTVAVVAACGGASEGPNESPALVPGARTDGKLTIGISFDQPGIGLKDGTSYRGFDVETATYVAKALGVPEANITWREATGSDREKLLMSGEVDLVFSTYSITDERKQVVDFAGPYFVAHQDLLVRRNDTEITGPETLNGKDLCSVPGTTSAANVVQQYQGRITLKELPHFSDCVRALADSQVDAVTTDDVILAGYASEPQYQGALKVVGRGFSDETYGVGVKKGNTVLRDQVNEALKQYVADGSWRRALGITVAPSGYALPGPPNPGTA
ncbi:glutamate ABC transporter substrate-binding protein [Pseudonocardia sp. TRM90224]|uniref:glutamate ABC transporter substrate-binding protein n=1 Tax=Pseudonocardia sp. TRM90224 TaxID=2812678 RepID=UPI001E63EA4D|nr:glutamate ABC transporter substrate-binding protein [Pseudonocardia sp. TRM90224]